MKHTTIQAQLSGQDKLSEFWGNLELPVVNAPEVRPTFHESGYCSGHAQERLAVPGLLDWLEAHCPDDTGHFHHWRSENGNTRTGSAWCWVQFKDKRSLVFLSHAYDGVPDVYAMTN